MKVLVKEKIGDSGVQLLRDAGLEVELGIDWDQAELERRIGEFDGILIRSATQLDADLLERAERLKAVGRAGVGVDNVDVDAATKRGVIVANAPQSNVITAAEHTLALLLALARKVPQAHGSLTGGAWERSEFSGVELYEKTLGVLGFGRIGQLVAQRALGFGMRVVAFDAYVAEERFRELGVERAESSDELYSRADFITVHLPVTAGDRELARRGRLRGDEGRRARDQRGARQADGRGGAARGARLRARSPAPRSTCSARSRSPRTRCSAIPTWWSRRTSAPPPPRPPTAPATRPPSRWWRRSPAASSRAR